MKVMDKLEDCKRNHEEKRSKLDKALNAHEGLLAAFVKMKTRALPINADLS